MSGRKGPATLYCPMCASEQSMRVLNSWGPEGHEYIGRDHGAITLNNYPEIKAFHRIRVCSNCDIQTSYWEIDSHLFNEFLSLWQKKRKIEEALIQAQDMAKDTSKAANQIKKSLVL